MIVEDDEDDEVGEKPVIKKKMSVKRRRSARRSTTEQDLKNGMKSKLASLRKDLKKDDKGAHSSSLKAMIDQFETAVAALEMSERQVTQEDSDSDSHEPILGVKAIAQKIQAQTKAVEDLDCAQMPPSQILKLKQALDLDDEKLSKPVPLSRRSESKVKLIAKQLAEAEKRRIQMEKLAKSQMCKSPKEQVKSFFFCLLKVIRSRTVVVRCSLLDSQSQLNVLDFIVPLMHNVIFFKFSNLSQDIKKAASTSFINELLEMARAEESNEKTNEPSSKVEEPHDFKQSLLAARKKITHREEEQQKSKKQDKKETPEKPARVEPEPEKEEKLDTPCLQPDETVDPFVREVLGSMTVPEPVKQKIRIECWSLFNDPRTPKGVKQCILATMLSKVQNE